LEVLIFPDLFHNVPYAIYLAEIILPVIGFSLGYLAASVFRLKHSVRRTIAIEAGIQNVSTALTIISLSFPFEVCKVNVIKLDKLKTANLFHLLLNFK
jgi:predicted Na+-dependent transporter